MPAPCCVQCACAREEKLPWQVCVGVGQVVSVAMPSRPNQGETVNETRKRQQETCTNIQMKVIWRCVKKRK